jgi:hypothetical protein
MPMMPYHMEKGAILSIFEDFLNEVNSSPLTAVLTLNALRNPGRTLHGSRLFDDLTLIGNPPSTGGTWSQHFLDDWLGSSQSPNQPWTGYWIGYRGDVDAIVRLTFRRAMEAALGVDHDAAEVPDPPPRHWPIQILWHCGQPWFEGWVAWNERPPDGGEVTVVFATPGHIGGVVRRRITAPPARRGRDYEEDPPRLTAPDGAVRSRGLVVVSHRDHAREAPSEVFQRSSQGAWTVPSIVTHVGEGDVMTVAPSEAEGGVRAGGRQYQA